MSCVMVFPGYIISLVTVKHLIQQLIGGFPLIHLTMFTAAIGCKCTNISGAYQNANEYHSFFS